LTNSMFFVDASRVCGYVLDNKLLVNAYEKTLLPTSQ